MVQFGLILCFLFSFLFFSFFFGGGGRGGGGGGSVSTRCVQNYARVFLLFYLLLFLFEIVWLCHDFVCVCVCV